MCSRLRPVARARSTRSRTPATRRPGSSSRARLRVRELPRDRRPRGRAGAAARAGRRGGSIRPRSRPRSRPGRACRIASPDSAKGERAAARTELTQFLASLGGPLVSASGASDALTVERGRQLYHSIGCVACHAPFERADTLAKPLWEFPRRSSPPWRRRRSRRRRAFAVISPESPRARRSKRSRATSRIRSRPIRPAACPRSLSAGEAGDIAAYLFYEDAVDRGAVLAPGPGLLLESYEADFAGETADFDALVPVRTSVASSFFEGVPHREDDFGLPLPRADRGPGRGSSTASRRAPTTARCSTSTGSAWSTTTASTRCPSTRARSTSEPGRHAFEVNYFEHLGGDGLEVSWSGPGFEKRALGFDVLSHLEVHARQASGEAVHARSRARRARPHALRDARLHELPRSRRARSAKPFAELDPRRGCLAREPEGRRAALSPSLRASARTRWRRCEARTPPARTPEAKLSARARAPRLRRLPRARGELAGPDDARRRYFQVQKRARPRRPRAALPPSLERVGAKLKPAWFHEVLERRRPRAALHEDAHAAVRQRERRRATGALRRPSTRSCATSASPSSRPPPSRPARPSRARSGLGCIQCHEFAGHPSIGIPAVDLAKVHERIYPGWFRELLMDPIALKMNTRMPTFWVERQEPRRTLPRRRSRAAGRTRCGATSRSGSSMPLPGGAGAARGRVRGRGLRHARVRRRVHGGRQPAHARASACPSACTTPSTSRTRAWRRPGAGASSTRAARGTRAPDSSRSRRARTCSSSRAATDS